MKRTKCQYSEKTVLKIIRYNQRQVDEANQNLEILQASDRLMSKLMGGSISSLFGDLQYSFYGQMLYPTRPIGILKLSRKDNK